MIDPYVNSIYIVDVDHEIFHSPTELTIPIDRVIQLYFSTDDIAIYMSSAVPSVTSLGRETNHFTHYPLIQEEHARTRYVLWGFTNSPGDMTQTGKDLFVNIVTWLGLHNPVAAFTFSTTGARAHIPCANVILRNAF